MVLNSTATVLTEKIWGREHVGVIPVWNVTINQWAGHWWNNYRGVHGQSIQPTTNWISKMSQLIATSQRSNKWQDYPLQYPAFQSFQTEVHTRVHWSMERLSSFTSPVYTTHWTIFIAKLYFPLWLICLK